MRRFALTAILLFAPSVAAAANVRLDRPRILLSNGSGKGTSAATFKARCTSDPAYQKRCQSGLAGADGGSFPAIAHAAAYVVGGDASGCAAALAAAQALAADAPGSPDPHSFISNHGRAMIQLAVTRDWCDPVLAAPEKQSLEDAITSYADWYLANAAPLDVYHDDMNNVWNAVALAGLTLKGTAADAKADEYLAKADDQWKKTIFPALAYAGDYWHEGFVYVQPAVGSAAWYATAWSIATDEDIFAYAKTSANDLFEGYLRMHAYAMRPDYNYAYFGDTTDNKQSIELFSRYLVDMMTLGTGSPLGQGLSLEIEANSQPYYDYSGSDGYLLALFHDAAKDASATPRSTLPTGRWLGKGAADVATLRSGWGKDDTFVYLACGDYLGAHQHDETGSFQLFRRSILSGPDGYYDAFDSDHWANYYSQHSVHANTLAVYQPGEVFPTSKSIGDPAQNVNDGGQRVLRMDKNGTHFPSPDLPTYMANKTGGSQYETGDLQTFEQTSCYDYVACDVTAAYDSPGATTNGNAAKLSEAARQFVFLKPEILVIFDRVEATDVAYDKRFLLHTPVMPDVTGSTYTVTNGKGRLIAQTLLPASADVVVVTNFEVEGKAHPPSQSGNESGGIRLEISPKAEQKRDYFLHVLDATDPSKSTPPAASVTEDDARATVTIDDGTTAFVISFAKTGKLGGHLTAKKKSDSSTLCDQDLGGTGSGGGSTSSSSSGSSSSGAPATGAGGGASAASGQPGDAGGCGCRAAKSDGSGVAVLALAALAATVARRRRRRA